MSSRRQFATLHNRQTALRKYISSNGHDIIGVNLFRDIVSNTQNATSVAYSSDYIYEIEKKGNMFIKDISLNINKGVASQTGGTTLEMVNWWVPYAFNRIEIIVNNNEIIRTLYPEEIVSYFSWMVDEREFQYEQRRLGYELVAATRQTNATTAQDYVLPISKMLAFFSKPMPLFLLHDSINIRVYYSDINAILQYDGTAPLLALTQTMEVSWLENDHIANFVKQESLKKPWLIFDHELQKATFTEVSGSTQYRHRLDHLKGEDVVKMYIYVRTSANLTSNGVRVWDNYQQITTDYSLKDGNRRLHDSNVDLTHSFYKFHLIDQYNPKNKKQLFDDDVYLMSFSNNLKDSYPSQESHESNDRSLQYAGSKFFPHHESPELIINYSGALGANNQVDVLISSVQILEIKQGEIRQI